MDTVRTQTKRNRNILQTFLSITGLYYVNEIHIRSLLHWYCIGAIVSTSLPSHYVQNSPTSAKTIKIASHPYRFLLCSFYGLQDHTAPDQFYTDVVGTWSGVTGVIINGVNVCKLSVIFGNFFNGTRVPTL